jgi:hypothetical protein
MIQTRFHRILATATGPANQGGGIGFPGSVEKAGHDVIVSLSGSSLVFLIGWT